ncbi:hypothetical protein A2335_03455 [Candidatus Peregrinibacteria bacterium RIFOXYB2_FULL_32_7]|nr:MAG: hypothetical protein A2335_03455 [Candidatus Peregrinibacteria bacterium RIFOXYB2_FULL_32_7]
MNKRDIFYLKHILDSARVINNFINESSQEDFLQNRMMQDAVIRNLEIIGEATKHLTKECKEKYPEVEWKRLTGMRDVLSHDYFGIDLNIIWEVITEKIYDLGRKIAIIIQNF